MQKVMHYNQNLSHQISHASAFRACGFSTTPDPRKEADVHVISGPHFAKQYWLDHPRVLEIDRAWWGDPNSVSIGWLQPDGTRKFATGDAPRVQPTMMEWKARECSCLVMADYRQDVSEIVSAAKMRFTTVHVRYHPADSTRRHLTTLETDLCLHDVAIGTSGTSLFTAIKMGVPSICLDPQSECAPVCADSIDAELYRGERSEWIHSMTYKQFTLEEIANGTAWSLLKNVI